MNDRIIHELFADIITFVNTPAADDEMEIADWIDKQREQPAVDDADLLTKAFALIEEEGKQYWAGRSGAMMSALYDALSDDRGADLICVLETLLEAEPIERDRLVDQLVDVVDF